MPEGTDAQPARAGPVRPRRAAGEPRGVLRADGIERRPDAGVQTVAPVGTAVDAGVLGSGLT